MGKTFRFNPDNPRERNKLMKNANKNKGPEKRNAYDIKDVDNHKNKKNHKHGHYDKLRIPGYFEDENKKGPKV